MPLFNKAGFRIDTVLSGEHVEREFVTHRLSFLARKLQGTEEFKSRLLSPPALATDQWWESRFALCKSVEGVEDNFFASISHTKGISIAATCIADERILGIGIDIERPDRLISSRAAMRIQRLVDESEEPELLRWIRYEAAFKACFGDRVMKNADTENFVAMGCEICTALETYEEFVVGKAIARRKV